MKDFIRRIQKLESHLKDSAKNERMKMDSMILDPEEPIPYAKIHRIKGNDKRKIFVIPSFGGEKKIVAF